MNINSSNNDQPDDPLLMRFGKHQLRPWIVFSFMGSLVVLLLILVSYLGVSYQLTLELSHLQASKLKEPIFSSDKGATKGATEYLINDLKHIGLWEIPDSTEVPRFFIKSYPADLKNINDVSVRKRVFLNTLLPHALFVRQEALKRRNKLQSILKKIDCADKNLDFAKRVMLESQCSWNDFLQEEDISFIQSLSKDYRTTSAEILLERVDAIPVSIILAQGALESSWGSSRFTREGNSIFGMWTWTTPGIVPSEREDGKTHKVKIYANVLESVRAYQLTLNRLDSYKELRQLRQYTDNPLILAEGLKLYSERGQDYVEDIKKVILSNDLQRYDSCNLSDLDLPELSSPVTGLINSAELRSASL